jgi:hypothetical protein
MSFVSFNWQHQLIFLFLHLAWHCSFILSPFINSNPASRLSFEWNSPFVFDYGCLYVVANLLDTTYGV